MQKFFLFLFFATLLVIEGWGQATRSVAKPTATDKRLALVIGNSTYAGKPLPNARNDAEDMAATLRSLGFEVILKHNIGQDDFETTLSEFTAKLHNYAVGLFYFAGHGFEGADNTNYLMSVDMRDGLNETLAKKKSLSLTDIMNSMKEANSRTNILLVDACRNNPFRSWGRSDKKGLGSVSAPAGTIAFFAASPGQEASENPGARNGLFTQELLRNLKTPNLELISIFKTTARAVSAQNKTQTPYQAGFITDDFYFLLKETPSPSDPNKNPVLDLPPFLELVRVGGGTFKREGYDVTVNSFQMGKYEVTVGQFAQFVAETNYKTDAEKSDGSYIAENGSWTKKAGINWRHDEEGRIRPTDKYNHPVVHVSHNDAVAFCVWLSKKEGKPYRLPTEAEWEYAAGGGSQNRTAWAGTDSVSNLSEYGNIDSKNDSYAFTSPVGFLKANALGLHDMSGNVWEWCADWYGDYPNKQTLVNPTGPGSGPNRVLRGGSWAYEPYYARVEFRSCNRPDICGGHYGFRVVVSQSQ